MSVYDLDKLMMQARLVAAEYRAATGQTMPVSSELAIYDTCRLLGLQIAPKDRAGVDVVGPDAAYQVKSRVLFHPQKRGYRVGRINFNGDWTHVLLVLYDAQYEPIEIWQNTREVLERHVEHERPNPRGAMTIEKFKAIGTCLWRKEADSDDGL